jgi:hypothetical protein
MQNMGLPCMNKSALIGLYQQRQFAFFSLQRGLLQKAAIALPSRQIAAQTQKNRLT